MNHLEYIKEVENANTVFIFIHGIVGSPNHFDDFICHVPSNYSIYNILLEGHGKSVKDFSKASKTKWEKQVENLVHRLSTMYDNIYLVAHSMGTLLSIQNAIKNKKVKGLFLLATPFKMMLMPSMIKTSFKIYLNKISDKDIKTKEAKRCYSIGSSKNIFSYLGWIPRFIDLFKISKETKKVVKNLNVPTYVYLSKKDEVVSKKSIKYLKDNKNISTYTLENSTHFYYDKFDKLFLIEEFTKFVESTYK